MKRGIGLAVVLAALATASPAAAFDAPELFVRLQPWDSHEPAGDWIPLVSAPAFEYLAGYQIGYRLQDSPDPNEFQRVDLQVVGVPDGQPTQPYAADRYCVGKAGTVGTIEEAGSEVQFEGDGVYTVKVSIGPGSGGESGCLSGPSTTASFSVGTRIAPSLVGAPMTFRVNPPKSDDFVGVNAPRPSGGYPDVRCALDATVQPDGSLKGSKVAPDPSYEQSEVPEDAFPRPGAWSCVARGWVEGVNDEFERTNFYTPWSAPLAFDVVSDVRRRSGRIRHPRAKRPRFTFGAEWAALASGGRGTLALYRFNRRCKARRVATYHRSFAPKGLRLRVRRPRPGFYVGKLAFSGTRFIRAGVDPTRVLLQVIGNGLGFADPQVFPCRRLP